MHKVRKKDGNRVMAWQLGKHSVMEQTLIENKKIILRKDNCYELASLEAVRSGHSGEIANLGDWFRVEQMDGELYPYPISNTYFNQNFRHIFDDEFEVIPKTIDAWFADSKLCVEVEYLIRTGQLIITESDLEHYFLATNLWGTTLSAPQNSVILFYEIRRTQEGEIFFIDWNLVARFAFERDYLIIE